MSELLQPVKTIPHPWKKEQTRSVFEFPITRKIVIEADEQITDEQLVSLADRVNSEELSVRIIGLGYDIKLTP